MDHSPADNNSKGSSRGLMVFTPSLRSAFSSKDVSPSALVLQFRGIRVPLEGLFNCKSRSLQVMSDHEWLKKEEIHRDRPTPQLILVEDFVAAMKCQQQQPA